ncbi:MAG: hypothetical protein LBK13_13545 [Spirochaetales bacterium]|nr:hypothetical protein [Spirochaetales bacterium]
MILVSVQDRYLIVDSSYGWELRFNDTKVLRYYSGRYIADLYAKIGSEGHGDDILRNVKLWYDDKDEPGRFDWQLSEIPIVELTGVNGQVVQVANWPEEQPVRVMNFPEVQKVERSEYSRFYCGAFETAYSFIGFINGLGSRFRVDIGAGGFRACFDGFLMVSPSSSSSGSVAVFLNGFLDYGGGDEFAVYGNGTRYPDITSLAAGGVCFSYLAAGGGQMRVSYSLRFLAIGDPA